jgi:hypothetical protein
MPLRERLHERLGKWLRKRTWRPGIPRLVGGVAALLLWAPLEAGAGCHDECTGDRERCHGVCRAVGPPADCQSCDAEAARCIEWCDAWPQHEATGKCVDACYEAEGPCSDACASAADPDACEARCWDAADACAAGCG